MKNPSLQNINHNDVNLLSFGNKLNVDYYGAIEELCAAASKSTTRLRALEIHQPTSQYILLCDKLLAEIATYIVDRRVHFMPYFKELFEKTAANHNCATCAGGCYAQHDLKFQELIQSQLKVKDFLYRLQMLSLPLHAESIYPDVYRVLRNQIALLENSLTDLSYLEEAYLIPKVADAQKQINVRG